MSTDPRHALIIGVDALRNHPEKSLHGARNSALAWAATLARLGFSASEITLCAELDAPRLAELDRIFPEGRPALRSDSRHGIRSSTRELGENLRDNPDLEAILIYCGHSTTREGEVFLVPADADLNDPADPRLVGLSLPAVKKHLADEQSRLIAIFDTCEAAQLVPDRRWDALTVLAATGPGEEEHEVQVFGRPMGAFSAAAALVLGSVKAGVEGGHRAYDLTVRQLLDRATATAASAFGITLSPRLLHGDDQRAVLQRRDLSTLATTGETVSGPGWQLSGNTTWVQAGHNIGLGAFPAAYPRPDGDTGYWFVGVNHSGRSVWQRVDQGNGKVGELEGGWTDLELLPQSWLTCWLTAEAVNEGGTGRWLFTAGQQSAGTVVAIAQSNNQKVTASINLREVTGPLAMAPMGSGVNDKPNTGVCVSWATKADKESWQVNLMRIWYDNGALNTASIGSLPLTLTPDNESITKVSAPFLVRGALGTPTDAETTLLIGLFVWTDSGTSYLCTRICSVNAKGEEFHADDDWTMKQESILDESHPAALPIPYCFKGDTGTEWRYEIAFVNGAGNMMIGYSSMGATMENEKVPLLRNKTFGPGRPCLVMASQGDGLELVAYQQGEDRLLLTFGRDPDPARVAAPAP